MPFRLHGRGMEKADNVCRCACAFTIDREECKPVSISLSIQWFGDVSAVSISIAIAVAAVFACRHGSLAAHARNAFHSNGLNVQSESSEPKVKVDSQSRLLSFLWQIQRSAISDLVHFDWWRHCWTTDIAVRPCPPATDSVDVRRFKTVISALSRCHRNETRNGRLGEIGPNHPDLAAAP